jgi:hypothetical protein
MGDCIAEDAGGANCGGGRGITTAAKGSLDVLGRTVSKGFCTTGGAPEAEELLWLTPEETE